MKVCFWKLATRFSMRLVPESQIPASGQHVQLVFMTVLQNQTMLLPDLPVYYFCKCNWNKVNGCKIELCFAYVIEFLHEYLLILLQPRTLNEDKLIKGWRNFCI